MMCKYFSHSFQVFLLFLSTLPHYQTEYLILRKWPISSGNDDDEAGWFESGSKELFDHVDF